MITLEDVIFELEQNQKSSDEIADQIRKYSLVKLKLVFLGTKTKRQEVNQTLQRLRDQFADLRDRACELETILREAQMIEYPLLLSLITGILTKMLGEEYLVVTRVYHDQQINWAVSNVLDNEIIMEDITVPYDQIRSASDLVGLSFSRCSTANLQDITMFLMEKSELAAYPFLQSELQSFVNFKLNNLEEDHSILVSQFLERYQKIKRK